MPKSPPFSPKAMFLAIFALAFLFTFIQIGAISIVFEKLGLSQHSAIVLLFASLFGSGINLPVFSVEADAKTHEELPWYLRSLLQKPQIPFTGRTVIAMNVGGGLIPIAFSLYLMLYHHLPFSNILISIAITSAISYLVSRPIPGFGIGMPIFVAPICAALVAVIINPEMSAPLAYICGTMGVLIGADLFRLKDIRHMGVPIASIGGAGTFDGIFITGIVAVLLA